MRSRVGRAAARSCPDARPQRRPPRSGAAGFGNRFHGGIILPRLCLKALPTRGRVRLLLSRSATRFLDSSKEELCSEGTSETPHRPLARCARARHGRRACAHGRHGRRLASERKGNDAHGSDRELRPRGDVRRQQRRQGVYQADRHRGERDRGLRPRAATRPGLRLRQPAGHLLPRQRPGCDVCQGRQPRATRQPEERQVLLSEPARGLHVQRPPVCSAEGFLDARARAQHVLLEEGGADEQGLPEDVDAAGRGGEEAHAVGPGRPLHQP